MAFTADHLSSDPPSRVEWIDDTSANIVFSSPAVALKALEQLTHPSHYESLSELHLRPAKQSSAYPDSKLEVRLALVTDQKRPRAYEASRFYMMHPELDPREQRRKGRNGLEHHNHYRGGRYGQDEQRRRRRDDRDQGFEPTMYDDDAGAIAKGSTSRRGSASMRSTNSSDIASSAGDRHRCQGRENYSRTRGRDRSASPRRYDEDRPISESRRRDRRRTPPNAHHSRTWGVNHRENHDKELFPPKQALKAALNDAEKELFPNKHLAANLKKELFPSKAKQSHHRRSDAFDAADETADLFTKRLDFARVGTSAKSMKMAEPSYGRLNSNTNPDSAIVDSPLDNGLSIRGVSKQQDQGFSIRGIAADSAGVNTLKELFPGKAVGNAGKELFVEKLQGGRTRRNKAEDMFY
ncbi:MAG: hypothetical protein Q9195_000998 [Heterodermia aff. obscurata]